MDLNKCFFRQQYTSGGCPPTAVLTNGRLLLKNNVGTYQKDKVAKFHCSRGYLIGDSVEDDVKCVEISQGMFKWQFVKFPQDGGCKKGMLYLE